jgi:hypothetical protein
MEIEAERLFFLGIGLALSCSRNLTSEEYFQFLQKIDVNRAGFDRTFSSFSAFEAEVKSLELRAESFMSR